MSGSAGRSLLQGPLTESPRSPGLSPLLRAQGCLWGKGGKGSERRDNASLAGVAENLLNRRHSVPSRAPLPEAPPGEPGLPETETRPE